MPIGELVQTADWKAEKHVPVIDAPETAKPGEPFQVTVSVGKEVPHPNTTEHHIAWVSVYFHPEGEKFPHHVARFDFAAHGASTQGPNTSTVYTEPVATFIMRTEKSGTLYAVSFCNIHGLWEGSKGIAVE
ncbi:class II SORL domain-containing protein [Candidatus Bipolaricaulota sp. J31]